MLSLLPTLIYTLGGLKDVEPAQCVASEGEVSACFAPVHSHDFEPRATMVAYLSPLRPA